MHSIRISGVYPAAILQFLFSKDSKLADSAQIYDGVKFRPDITLIMEEDTLIGTNAIILVHNLVMKEGSQINPGAILTGRQPIFLGRNVVISYGVVMMTSSDTPKGKHMNDASPERERAVKQAPIRIRDNSFIGANAVIMPGVDIGPNSVVGAGCYVDKTVGPNKQLIPISGLFVDLERLKK